MNNLKNNKKGFTLIELIIAMLIIVIVFGILANFVGFASRFYSDESSQVVSQESIRILSLSFEKDVRKMAEKADFINIVETGGIRSITL